MDGNFGRAMVAGFGATLVMLIIQAMAPMMGLPRMDWYFSVESATSNRVTRR